MLSITCYILGLIAWLIPANAQSQGSPSIEINQTPVLYSDTPLSAEPGSLLQLTGAHISNSRTVLFSAASDRHDSTRKAEPFVEGKKEANIIARSTEFDRLTIQVPEDIQSHTPYAIQVVSDAGILSNTILLNAPLPEWFSPSVVPARDNEVARTRTIKIVGRNLHCRAFCRARLSGDTVINLEQSTVQNPALQELENPAVIFKLPAHIPAGTFRVELSTRNGEWLPVGKTELQVQNVSERTELSPNEKRFGHCQPDDNLDDTSCLQLALDEAALSGKTLFIPAGRWDIQSRSDPTSATLTIPKGVWMRGDDNKITSLVSHAPSGSTSMMILSGSNRIRRLWLSYAETGTSTSTLIQLGRKQERDSGLADITIEDSHFSNANHAVVDSGLPIRNLVIRHNEFNIVGTAIYLIGNRYWSTPRFLLINSIITDNTFHTAGKSRSPAETPIASEIGGSTNLDFSENKAVADDQNNMKTGWRAGFFFHLQESHENLLIQNNTIECAGAGGDGEAIALDNNANIQAFPYPQPVLQSTATSITVPGLPGRIQNGANIDPKTYYTNLWLQIVDGLGNGQSRRVTGYTVNTEDNTTTYLVAPGFTVPPETASSKVFVSRLFKAATIVGNRIDNRLPQCLRPNRSPSRGGSLALWAQTQSSLVSGNTQYHSDGIVVKHTLGAENNVLNCSDCEPGMIRHVDLAIAHNRLVGEQNKPPPCSPSGIQLRFGAAPVGDTQRPVIGLNTRITNNLISQADGAALSLKLDWHSGPASAAGALIDGTIVDGNIIEPLPGGHITGSCGSRTSPRGLQLDGGHLIRNTVLHHNTCKGVSGLLDHGGKTTRYCKDATPGSCECNLP